MEVNKKMISIYHILNLSFRMDGSVWLGPNAVLGKKCFALRASKYVIEFKDIRST